MNLETLFMNGYKPDSEFENDPGSTTNSELQKLFDQAQYIPGYDSVIIQSGELNAFTYNNENYALNRWLKKFMAGEVPGCKKVEIYAGPVIIYEDVDGKQKNGIIDDYILPELAKPADQRKIVLYYNASRYFTHSYRIGSKLMVFGVHTFLTSQSGYTNYIYDFLKKENSTMAEFCDDDIRHDKKYGETHKIKRVTSASDLDLFIRETYTKDEYEAMKERLSDPDFGKEYASLSDSEFLDMIDKKFGN